MWLIQIPKTRTGLRGYVSAKSNMLRKFKIIISHTDIFIRIPFSSVFLNKELSVEEYCGCFIQIYSRLRYKRQLRLHQPTSSRRTKGLKWNVVNSARFIAAFFKYRRSLNYYGNHPNMKDCCPRDLLSRKCRSSSFVCY